MATVLTVSPAPCTLELDSGTWLELDFCELLDLSFESEELSLDAEELPLDEEELSLEADELSLEPDEFPFEEELFLSSESDDSGSPISFQSFLVHR
jgi:hypothetical protein